MATALLRRHALRRVARLVVVCLLLLGTGCVQQGYAATFVNDTPDVATTHPITPQVGQKSESFQPGQQRVERHVGFNAIDYRLTAADGRDLGCLRPPAATFHPHNVVLYFSRAEPICPSYGFIGFVHAIAVGRGFALLPLAGYVVGPIGTAIWILLWARYRSRRTRVFAAIEVVGLCVLSVVLAVLLVRWGRP